VSLALIITVVLALAYGAGTIAHRISYRRVIKRRIRK
jgi:hypothetical protein